jgi:hypothetical protein
MSSKNEIAARRLDLAARGVDLLSSLIDIASSKNNLTAVALEIGSWLGRERINRYELQFCFEHARGLLIPNSRGETFLKDVRTGVSSHAVLPLLVQPSGALGRLLLNDPFLCWIVSTTTCFFQYHGEEYVTEEILNLIVNTVFSRKNEHLSQYRLAHHPLRIQLQPVILKLVSSVWLNVVNSGSKDLQPMTAIPGICLYGHRLQNEFLSRFIINIGRDYKKMMIQTRIVPSDLLLWLLYHFHGRIRVVLAGKIAHEQQLGQEDREIELRIKVQCPADGSCQIEPRDSDTIILCTDVAGTYKELLSGQFTDNIDVKIKSRARNSLYTTATRYSTEGRLGRDTLKVQIKCTAQIIVRWILERPIKPSLRHRLAFPIIIKEQAKASDIIGTVADLLARQPSMLNLRWGDMSNQSVVFAETSDIHLDEYNSGFGAADGEHIDNPVHQTQEDEEPFEELGSHHPEDLLRYFPCLRDLLEAAAQACQCIYCRRPPLEIRLHRQLGKALKPGCFQWSAFADVMDLIAHAIADGFGLPDVSAVRSLELDHYGTSYLLLRLCHDREVSWEQWMRIAAEVFLGCPNSAEASYSPAEGAHFYMSPRETHFVGVDVYDMTTVAVQYGSSAVVTPWLDLSRPIQINGCFAFEIVHGRLCVRLETSMEQRFQSVEDEFAIIKTQMADDFTPHDNCVDAATLKAGDEWVPKLDQHCIESDVMLISAGHNTFKLLQRVRSDTTSRLIDPSRAMLKIAQNPIQCFCSHITENRLQHVEVSHGGLSYHIAPSTFDKIIGTWLSVDKPPQRSYQASSSSSGQKKAKPPDLTLFSQRTGNATLFISDQFDCHAKFNVALALSPQEAVTINHAGACMQCCVDQTVKMRIDSPPDRFDGSRVPDDRWVINTTKKLRDIPIHYVAVRQNNLEQ